MKNLLKILPALLLLTAVITALAACTPAPAAQTGGSGEAQNEDDASLPDLAGTSWILDSYGPADSPISPLPGAPATAIFDENGQMGGTTGCNSYFAQLVSGESGVSITGVGQTEMACEPPRMEQEAAFTAALQAVTAVTLESDTLTMTYDGGELRFVREVPMPDSVLEGTVWQLESFESGDSVSSTVAGSELTLTLQNGQASGFGGCNQFGGTYEVDGDAITLRDLAQTLRACAEEALNQQETTYMGALSSVTSYELEEDRLLLRHPDGALHFRAAGGESAPGGASGAAGDTLEGTAWRLIAFVTDGTLQEPVPETTVTAQFAGGQVTGEAGCNQYFADYTIEGSTLTIGQPGSTRMACGEPVMAQETSFLQALATSTGYTIADGQLTLTHDGGELHFESVSADSSEQ